MNRIRQRRRATTLRLMFFNGCRHLFTTSPVHGLLFHLQLFVLSARSSSSSSTTTMCCTSPPHLIISYGNLLRMFNMYCNKYEKRVKSDNVYNTLLHAICLIRCSAYEHTRGRAHSTGTGTGTVRFGGLFVFLFLFLLLWQTAAKQDDGRRLLDNDGGDYYYCMLYGAFHSYIRLFIV